MTPKITLTDQVDAAAIQKLAHALARFNEEKGGPRNARVLLLLVTDPETNELLGGLYGATVYDQLKIEVLYLPENLRGTGIGRQLMEQAEAEAIRRGCRGAFLETASFQAPGFYERLGYKQTHCTEDFPPGHKLFAMHKTFATKA